MIKYKKIRIGKKYIEALETKLGNKSLVVLKGKNGYVMCGYLDMAAADKFNDVAVKITGVAGIKDALKSSAAAVSNAAKGTGIYIGQPVEQILKVIA